MSRQALSIHIVARNEEANLPACLASAAFADEIVVQLDRSTDASLKIAQAAGARIIEGEWPIEGARRSHGIAACRGPWILELDADERVSDDLHRELETLLAAPGADYFLIPMHNHIGGKWVRHGWGAYNGTAAKRALFRKGHKLWGEGEVHPRISFSGQDGGTLTGHLDHFVYADTSDLLRRLDRYAALAARHAMLTGKIPTKRATFRRFFSRFLKSWWGRKGYLEGWQGISLALFSGLYPVLTHIKILERNDSGERMT